MAERKKPRTTGRRTPRKATTVRKKTTKSKTKTGTGARTKAKAKRKPQAKANTRTRPGPAGRPMGLTAAAGEQVRTVRIRNVPPDEVEDAIADERATADVVRVDRINQPDGLVTLVFTERVR
jgi:hypothetical protein